MRLLAALMLLAALPGAVLAQTTNAPEIRRLSLDDCLQIALQHNLDVQIRRYDPELARYSLSISQWAYDPQFSISGGHGYSATASGIDPTTKLPIPSSTQDRNFFSTSLSGVIPFGGPSYSIGAQASDQYGLRPREIELTNSFDTNIIRKLILAPYESVDGSMGFVQLRQPLLRNFLIDNTRLQIVLNRKNLKISDLQVRSQVMTTMTSVEQAYYDLIFSQENVRVQRAALQLAERLLEENRKRVEVGALAPLDEKQAEAQAAGSRAGLIAAVGTEDTQQRVLKNLLSDDYTKWENVSIQPMEKLIAMPQQFDLQESWRRGLTQRPDLLQQKLQLEKQGYVIKYAKNQILPQLDVVGTAGWSGSSVRNFDEVLDQIGGLNNPAWSIAGEMAVPLFNRAAVYNYRAAKATKEQLSLQLKRLQQGILILIEDDIAVARTSFQRVQATREARVYAEDALSAEEKKLASGKSTSFEVLRLQRDLTGARSDEIRALADYNIALSKLALDEGSTLERRGVTIETGDTKWPTPH